MKSKKMIRVFNILLVIVSILTIFLFSSENASNSTKTSKKIVKEVIQIIIKDKDDSKILEEKVDNNIVIIRKFAHLFEYFILGFLLTNVLKDYKKLSKKSLILITIIVFIYACSDEIHQLYVAGRSPKYLDILIDTIGAIFGIMTYYLIYRNKLKEE